jgi:hypothetical protein
MLSVIEKNYEVISLPVQEIPNSAYDMIVGRPHLQKYKLHLKWNLDDIPLETLRGFCTSDDPNLRALCGKGARTDSHTTTPTLQLDSSVCGECQPAVDMSKKDIV